MTKRPDNFPAWTATALFIALTIYCLPTPSEIFNINSSDRDIYLNAGVSIGTSGTVTMIFYWFLTRKLERSGYRTFKNSSIATYIGIKSNIAKLIIQASINGGRKDLKNSFDYAEQMMNPKGFLKLFEDGRESNEGYYAFENEMSYRNHEYETIVFHLKTLARLSNRIIDSGLVHDENLYQFFIRLDQTLSEIEYRGPGYDESKLLCSFVWGMFTGWNVVTGKNDEDPILDSLNKI